MWELESGPRPSAGGAAAAARSGSFDESSHLNSTDAGMAVGSTGDGALIAPFLHASMAAGDLEVGLHVNDVEVLAVGEGLVGID